MTSVIRVGVVGCGLIAQTMHLRVLADVPQFQLSSVCDVDPGVAEAVRARFGARTRCDSFEELVASPDVDAVLVATPDHFPPALAALRNGKHVLVEKPLCWTPAQGAELVEAARAAGVVAMIGYMRRYDSAYQRTIQHVRHLGRIRYGRIHDFACRFDKDRVLYDLAVPAGDAGTPRADFHLHGPEIAAALGREEAERFGSLYFMLLMFASHDISMARGIFGRPEEVVAAHASDDSSLAITLGYERSGPCAIELSVGTRYEWFDEEVALFGDEASLLLRLADPFVQYSRSSVGLRWRSEDGYEDRLFTAGSADAFRREWMHFLDCIEEGAPPLTPLEDGLADLELAVEIIRRLPLQTPLTAMTEERA
jgi:predicted dehydrogenase